MFKICTRAVPIAQGYIESLEDCWHTQFIQRSPEQKPLQVAVRACANLLCYRNGSCLGKQSTSQNGNVKPCSPNISPLTSNLHPTKPSNKAQFRHRRKQLPSLPPFNMQTTKLCVLALALPWEKRSKFRPEGCLYKLINADVNNKGIYTNTT